MLLGITGKAGCGKDTAGAYFRRTWGFHMYSFAQPLKLALAAMGFPEPKNRDLKEMAIAGFDFTWRQAAQSLGTEWGRGLDQDLWLKLAEAKMKTTPYLVITDVRFENEAASIRAHGGRIIHLIGRSVDLGEAAAHSSEAGVATHASDYVVNNSGDLAFLHSRLRDVMTQIEFMQTHNNYRNAGDFN